MTVHSISIIIPYYKRENDLKRLLSSLAALDLSNIDLETLVVEDGSPISNSDQIISQFPQLHLKIFSNDRNRGPGHSRNHGALKATGHYLWFLDTDTQAQDPSVLQSLLKQLVNNPDCLAAGGYTEMLKGNPEIMRPWVLPSFHFVFETVPIVESYQERVPYLSTTSLFVRKSDFLKVGGFDESLKMNEDNEFCIALKSLQPKGFFFQSAQTLVFHGLSSSGREGGFFDYFDDRRKYIYTKLSIRNILLKRYHSYRLPILFLLEAYSCLLFYYGFLIGKWHLTRLGVAQTNASFLTLVISDAWAVFKSCLEGLSLFISPSPSITPVRIAQTLKYKSQGSIPLAEQVKI